MKKFAVNTGLAADLSESEREVYADNIEEVIDQEANRIKADETLWYASYGATLKKYNPEKSGTDVIVTIKEDGYGQY